MIGTIGTIGIKEEDNLRMKRIIILLSAFLLTLGLVNPSSLAAQRRRTFKIASSVPESTPWGVALNRIAAEWLAITNGEIELAIYHGGTAGEEADVIRMVRMNQLQGAALSSFGLNSITPEIMALSSPFLIRNEQELTVVLDQVKDELAEKINQKGYFTLAWTRAGWVKIFSRDPVYVPADLKRQRIASNSDALQLMDAFRAMGYQMVPVGSNDLLIALNGGTVDAVYQSPIAIGGAQLFGILKNMSTINLAPFMGGIILSQAAWRTVPEQYRPQLIAATERIVRDLDISIQRLETDAIATMERYGLVIHTPSAAQEQLWYDDINRVIEDLLGRTIDRDIYLRIDGILQAHRRGN